MEIDALRSPALRDAHLTPLGKRLLHGRASGCVMRPHTRRYARQSPEPASTVQMLAKPGSRLCQKLIQGDAANFFRFSGVRAKGRYGRQNAPAPASMPHWPGDKSLQTAVGHGEDSPTAVAVHHDQTTGTTLGHIEFVGITNIKRQMVGRLGIHLLGGHTVEPFGCPASRPRSFLVRETLNSCRPGRI